ncbi:MAG: urate oxidase [Verrucomicrobium sp.]|nr:urate oxidase [Verrucomicrobium sp.]
MAQLLTNTYGKGRVRVLRVVRGAEGRHDVYEAEVKAMLEGDFAATYLTGDNGKVTPTDTVKNTVQILAQKHLGPCPQAFALALGDYFLSAYPAVAKARVEVTLRRWERYAGRPHTFQGGSSGLPYGRVEIDRENCRVEGGVRGLLVLNSTNSAFKGYPKDAYTTLPETDDRILATQVDATWLYAARGADFAADAAILETLLTTFADTFSPSLQNTLYLMGQAALEKVPAIEEIHLAMPNKHYLPVNFAPFKLENPGEIFLPTDEPHGQIEARLGR